MKIRPCKTRERVSGNLDDLLLISPGYQTRLEWEEQVDHKYLNCNKYRSIVNAQRTHQWRFWVTDLRHLCKVRAMTICLRPFVFLCPEAKYRITTKHMAVLPQRMMSSHPI